MSSMRLESKIYVGDLPRDAEERELERAFGEHGRVRSVWIARNPPGFAFVEMENRRDAEDAVRHLDGNVLCGVRIRVEMSTGKSKPKGFSGGGRPSGGRSFDPNDRCYECGGRGHYAYDCEKRRGGGRSRSNSRSPIARRRARRGSSERGSRSASKSRSPPPTRSRRNRSDSGSSGGYSR